jgi:lipopolysaccharide export system protein LptC
MSEAAVRERAVKRRWAIPGSSHDAVIRLAKIGLPAAVGVLLAFLLMSPLRETGEVSFILDKKEVDRAAERMRVQSARYTGKDKKGQQFLISAQSAIQRTSDVPIVDVRGMQARLQLDRGPAMIVARGGRYDLDKQTMAIPGEVLVSAPDGYRLVTQDVTVDMKARTVHGAGGVRGEMKLGRFTAGELAADIGEQRVVLSGGARLKIVQGAVR